MEYQSVVLKEVPVNIPVVHQELVSVIPQVPIESVATMILISVENGVVSHPVVPMRSVRMDTVSHVIHKKFPFKLSRLWPGSQLVLKILLKVVLARQKP